MRCPNCGNTTIVPCPVCQNGKFQCTACKWVGRKHIFEEKEGTTI